MPKRPVAVLLAVVFSMAIAGVARAQDEKEPKRKREETLIPVDFHGMRLMHLMDLVQDHAGSFLLPPQNLNLNAPVPVSGAKELTLKQLVSIFQAVLEVHAHTMVTVPVWPGVFVTKIVPTQQGRAYPGPTFSKEQVLENPALLEGRRDMVTVIFPLRYAQAMTVQSALRPLIDPRNGTIFGIPNVEVLVVTAFAPEVRRMVDIMRMMDVPGPPLALEVVFLKYAAAEDLLPILRAFSETTRQYRQQRAGGQGPQETAVNFIPDERTNSIILQGPPQVIEGLKSLVETVDVKLDYEPSRIHIYHLKHSNAEDASATINDLLQSVSLTQLEALYGEGGDEGDAALPGPQGQSRQAAAGRPGRLSRDDKEERAAAIPDKTTNSVIVVAGEAEYGVIEKILASLDVRRPQVLIEVVVLEVSEGEGYKFGVELTTLDGARDDSVRGFGATRFGFSNLVGEEGIPIQGGGIPRGQLPSPTQGAVFGLHRGKEWRVPAIVNLIGSDSAVNVMSLPRIVTNDNKEAILKVTDNVPIATSSSTAAVSNQLSFGGFQEAGIEITITPHISEGDYLRLEMEQSISQFTGTSQVISTGGTVVGLLPPSKTRRELKNVITVPDGKTVIIGGLTSRSQQRTVTKVPLLGDIPLLGELFKSTNLEWKRTNLYIFITPHIIREKGFKNLEKMSGAQAAEAKALGGDFSETDRYYRAAFREERRMQSFPRGRLHARMDYWTPGDAGGEE